MEEKIISGALIYKNNKILLIKNNNEWDIPHDYCEDEDSSEIAIKNMAEKTLSIKVEIIQIFGNYSYQLNNENINLILYESEISKEPENIEYKWFSKEELNSEKISKTVESFIHEIN